MTSTLRRSALTAFVTLSFAAIATQGFAQLQATPYISTGLTLPVGMVQDPVRSRHCSTSSSRAG